MVERSARCCSIAYKESHAYSLIDMLMPLCGKIVFHVTADLEISLLFDMFFSILSNGDILLNSRYLPCHLGGGGGGEAQWPVT